jgi:hypothetical protein
MNDKIPYFCRLLRKLDFFDQMLGCPYCTGFHCGWVVWGLEVVRRGEAPDSFGVELFLWSLAGATWCYLVDITAQKLEAGLE